MVSAILIGAGQRGMDAYAAYALQYPQRFRVVAVAEPDAARRTAMARSHKIPPERCFADWRPLLALGKIADCAMVCTQDRYHVEPAEAALKLGYHVLCEKPMHPEADQCIRLAEAAKASGKTLTICHVLRYSPFFTKIKELLDQGRIGQLMAVQHIEGVAFWHQAHSFVRGNWRNSRESSPMILQKSCHDMDILLWMMGSHCTKVSSFGSLGHFKPENAPAGAPDYCLDGCPAADSCPYNAEHIYLRDTGVHVPVIRKVVSLEDSDEAVRQALRRGPYGRCVYHCDNNVVDHQVVNLEFENGITASFTMCAFTWEGSRTVKIMGTYGQITGDVEQNEIRVVRFADGNTTVYNLDGGLEGHSGGDKGFMEDVVRQMCTGGAYAGRTGVDVSVESHRIALAAEESRVSGRTIVMKDFA